MEGFISLKPVGISHTNFNNDDHVKRTKTTQNGGKMKKY